MIQDKTILITGGTGSFGRAFVRLAHESNRIIIFSRDEVKQGEMRVEFPRCDYWIGDVRDKTRVYRAMEVRPDIVVHAAALKQVPTCEGFPREAKQTIIDGAENIIDAAIANNVPRVMALSTDKAVSPHNTYGACKLVSERMFIQGNHEAAGKRTRFACVRYGNVIGSRGSVIPLFLEQRKAGLLTVTDRRMTRFWITLDHAIRFVMHAIELMRGGEVFIPKLPSMTMLEMVKALGPNCKIKITGIRPGEKLHETLISRDEAKNAVFIRELDGWAIHPEYKRWGSPDPCPGEAWEGGKLTSDNNKLWLSPEGLLEMI